MKEQRVKLIRVCRRTSECSRQRTRIWLDRSLDCILHSTNIETPCAQLNPRQRGRWNIEFVELNRWTVKKELRLRNHFAKKKIWIKNKGEKRKNIDAMQCVDNFDFSLQCPHYVIHLLNYCKCSLSAPVITNTIFCPSSYQLFR